MSGVTMLEEMQAEAVGSGLRLLRIHPAVGDTSALLSDLILLSDLAARTGYRQLSPLLAAMRFGTVRLFIAHHVWAEVPRKIADLGSTGRLDPVVAERLWWSEYVQLIRVVDAGRLPRDDVSSLLAARDGSDAPTAALSGLLAPVAVLAQDKDLMAVGLAHEQWRPLARAALHVAAMGGGLHLGSKLTEATGYGLAWAVRALARSLRRPAVQLGVLAAMPILAATAQWWLPVVQRWSHDIREHSGPLGEAVMEVVERAGRRLVEALEAWDAAERGAAGDTLTHEVARLLAVAPAPMTRTEIAVALRPDATAVEHRHLLRALAGTLADCSAFAEVAGMRWQLGRAGPDFNAAALWLEAPSH